MFEIDSKWALLGATILAVWLAYLLTEKNGHGRLPPRVKGFPIIGSLVDMAKAGKAGTLHLTMQKWAKQYGPVYRVKVGFTEVSGAPYERSCLA
jgi:hypothetical protein